MNLLSEKSKMATLVTRYFVKIHKRFLHYGDCQIYVADRPFCSCGLLHWLRYMDYTLAKIIYPKFEADSCLEATGKKNIRLTKKRKEEYEQSMKILESVFGPLNRPSLEELKMDYDDMYKVLKFFPKKAFPGGFRRLKKWLEKEIAKN